MRAEMRRLRTALILGVLGLAGAAAARGLGAYEELFPTNPCQDGWAACQVDGQLIEPGVITDARGRPLPADMRLGWFDLKPTPALSPFVSLSDYDPDGELPPRAADAAAADDGVVAEEIARIEAERRAIEEERRAELEQVKAQEEAARKAREEAERLAREQEERRRQEEAERKAREEAEAAALADARARDAAEAERLAREQEERRRQEEAERKAREEAERKAREEAERKAREEAERLAKEKAEAEAREAERLAREEAARKAEEEAAARAAEEEARREREAAERAAKEKEEAERLARQAEEDKNCDDLSVLEPAALMGRLREGQIRCLEERFASASQTDKDKISRVLMVNAESAGSWEEWERLVQRHLESVDRSDPDLCFSYALFLSKGGPSRAWATIKWADAALENKSRWTGSTYKSRVYNLLELRAKAASSLWEAASQAMVAGQGDRAELQENEKKMRGMAKDYAMEWLDYARASGQNERAPMALCVSAAGSKKFCEG